MDIRESRSKVNKNRSQVSKETHRETSQQTLESKYVLGATVKREGCPWSDFTNSMELTLENSV